MVTSTAVFLNLDLWDTNPDLCCSSYRRRKFDYQGLKAGSYKGELMLDQICLDWGNIYKRIYNSLLNPDRQQEATASRHVLPAS